MGADSGWLQLRQRARGDSLRARDQSRWHRGEGGRRCRTGSQRSRWSSKLRSTPIIAQKHITVPGLRPGEVLEYHMVTVIHTPLAPGEFWADYDFDKSNIDLDEEVDVDVPADRPLKLKNKPGMDPKISEDHGRRIYHWTSSHLEREDDQKDKDKDKNKKKKKHPDDERPDIQLTTFVSWEQIGRWYAGLEKDRRAPSPEVRAKAEELTKGLNTDLDKVQALYDFVAKNFRYVSLSLGVGRYQPHAAGDVLHNQYGDCKDKHTLLASLLEAEGMHASSVLINSSRKLDPDVPSPSQFDHVITMLPMTTPNEEVWMDTTSEVAPFRLLAYTLRNKLALVIPAMRHAASWRKLPPTLPCPTAKLPRSMEKSTRSANSKPTCITPSAATKNFCCARFSAAFPKRNGSVSWKTSTPEWAAMSRI